MDPADDVEEGLLARYMRYACEPREYTYEDYQRDELHYAITIGYCDYVELDDFWEVGGYYKVHFEPLVESFGVVLPKPPKIKAGTIFYCAERLPRIRNNYYYYRLICNDPRFPGEERLLSKDQLSHPGSWSGWSRITSPLELLALAAGNDLPVSA